MKKLDKSDLTRIKSEITYAIKRGQIKLQSDQEKEERRQRESDEVMMAKATDIIKVLPETVASMIRIGAKKAVLIDEIHGLPRMASTSTLVGYARIVADMCAEMKLDVKLEHDHDGGGKDEWHNLVIRW